MTASTDMEIPHRRTGTTILDRANLLFPAQKKHTMCGLEVKRKFRLGG
jgi:hypothetical protein